VDLLFSFGDAHPALQCFFLLTIPQFFGSEAMAKNS
jgi:hypothetical protein